MITKTKLYRAFGVAEKRGPYEVCIPNVPNVYNPGRISLMKALGTYNAYIGSVR